METQSWMENLAFEQQMTASEIARAAQCATYLVKQVIETKPSFNLVFNHSFHLLLRRVNGENYSVPATPLPSSPSGGTNMKNSGYGSPKNSDRNAAAIAASGGNNILKKMYSNSTGHDYSKEKPPFVVKIKLFVANNTKHPYATAEMDLASLVAPDYSGFVQLKKVPNFDEAVADVDSGYAKFGGFVTDVMASCQTFLGLNNDSNSANAQASGDDANKGSTGASGSGKNTFVPVPNLPPPSPKMSPQSGSSSPKGHNFSQGYGLLTVPRGVPGNFGAKGTTTALLSSPDSIILDISFEVSSLNEVRGDSDRRRFLKSPEDGTEQ